jgi:uncharacterized protein HemX
MSTGLCDGRRQRRTAECDALSVTVVNTKSAEKSAKDAVAALSGTSGTSTDKAKGKTKSGGGGGGAIAGAIIGVLLALGIGVGAFFFVKKRNTGANVEQSNPEFKNPVASSEYDA